MSLKPEDLTSNNQNLILELTHQSWTHSQSYSCNPSSGDKDKKIPGDCWLHSSPWFSTRYRPKDIMWKVTLEACLLSDVHQHMCVCTCMCIWVYVCMCVYTKCYIHNMLLLCCTQWFLFKLDMLWVYGNIYVKCCLHF